MWEKTGSVEGCSFMEHDKQDAEIVVIDDDSMSLRLAKRVFDKAGMKGVYLSSGTDALAYFDEIGRASCRERV